MRKYWKSKKGLTLVELVVTVAVLGIVSGFSLTIVVTAMNNYSQAAIIEKEQNEAFLIESWILKKAQTCKKVEFIKHDITDPVTCMDVPNPTKLGDYLANIDDGIQTFSYEDETSPQKYILMTYQNIKKLTLSVKKKRWDKSNLELYKPLFYMNYEIEMINGYKLVGQVVMNNADKDEMNLLVVAAADSFVDSSPDFVLIDVGEESVSPGYEIAAIFEGCEEIS